MGVNRESMVGEWTVNRLEIWPGKLFHFDETATFDSFDFFERIEELGDALIKGESMTVSDMLYGWIAFGVAFLQKSTEGWGLNQLGSDGAEMDIGKLFGIKFD